MQQVIIYEFGHELYSLVYDQTGKLEYFLIDNESNVESIYLTKINSINQHTKLAFVEYEANQFGVVNLGDKSKLQAGSKIALQMTWLGDNDKRPKFSADIKLVGRYVILDKNLKSHVFARNLTSLEQIQEISNKYLDYGLIFRSALAKLDNLEHLDQEINELIAKIAQVQALESSSQAPKKLSEGMPKYLQLLRNLENSSKFTIITNSPLVYEYLSPYAKLWKLSPIQLNSMHVLDIREIQEQVSQAAVEVSGIKLEISKISGINLIDINGHNKLLDFYKINYLAIDEIIRQIKLRDLTGIILVDFIKNMSIKNQEQLTDKMTRMLINDWRHTKILGFSKAGIFELIRNK